MGTPTSIVENFNTPLLIIVRTTREKINRNREELSNTFNQEDLINIHRVFYLTAAGGTCFPGAHRVYTRKETEKNKDFF